MRRTFLLFWPITLLALLLMYLPLCTVVTYSFNEARFGAGWRGFTTKWYFELFENSLAIDAAYNSLILAATSTAIATVIGTLLGFGLARYNFIGKRLCEDLLHIPVIISDIVMAVALLSFFAFLRNKTGMFELGLSTMVISHVTFQIPFVAVVVRARLAQSDPRLDEAAHDLGATSLQTFRWVTLPLMLPGIISAALLAFTLSLDDFVVSFFTSGPDSTTLPILIYSSVKRGITPDINAVSSLIIATSILLTVLVAALQRRKI